MTELICQVYPSLPALQVLLALRDLQGDVNELVTGDIRLRRTKKHALETGHGFSIVVPDALKRPQALKSALSKLRDALQLDEIPRPRESVESASCLPLAEALAALLVATGEKFEEGAAGDPREGHCAEPIPEERLLVFRGSRQELHVLGEKIDGYTTAARRLVVEEDGAAIGFVLLVDDPRRDSLYPALEQNGLLENKIARCESFRCDRGTLYLPQGNRPPPAAVAAFWDLLAADQIREKCGSSDSWIIARLAGSQRLTMYAVPALQGHVQPAYEISVDLRDFTDVTFDRDALDAVYERHGYRVELRRGFGHGEGLRDRAGVEAELESIQQQIMALEARFEFLTAANRPSPLLYRFKGKDLHAAIAALRRFPIADLDNGKVRYGFAGTIDDPWGAHYIYFEPDATLMTEPFPEVYWSRCLGPRPYVFNQDPFWAEHYAQSSRAQVFVPAGSALFPQLHSWTAEDMDGYLGHIMEGWFARDGFSLPDRPIYLFDHATDGRRDVSVQILDLDQFDRFPEKIGWLNDNIQFLDGLEYLHDRIPEDASAMRELKLKERLAGELEDVRKVLLAHRKEMEMETKTESERVLSDLARLLEDTATRATAVSNEADTLLTKLSSEQAVLAGVQTGHAAVEDATRQTRESLQKRAKTFDADVAAIRRTLGDKQQQLERLRDEVDKFKDSFAKRLAALKI